MPDDERAVETPGTDTGTTGSAETVAADTQTADPYAGKSADELKAIAKEKDRFIGKQSEEIGGYRKLAEEVNYLKGRLEQQPRFDPGYQTGQSGQQPAPIAPQPEDEFDFGQPLKTVDKRIEKKFSDFEKRMNAMNQKRYADESEAAFNRTKPMAYSQEPELYRGIEREVENGLFNAWKGGSITKDSLSDPRIWHMAAVVIREGRGEGELIPRKRQVSAPASEKPSQARRTEEEPITFDDDDRQFIKEWGISREQAEKAMKEGARMRQSGDYK